MSRNHLFLLMICLPLAATGCDDDESGGGGGVLSSEIRYEDGRDTIDVIVSRELGGTEVLHARVRSLADGDTLDCTSMSAAISKLNASNDGLTYEGPPVTDAMLNPPLPSAEDLLNPTEDSYNARLESTYFVDVCIMDNGASVHQARYDLRQALDRRGDPGPDGKFDEFDDGQKIASNQLYAEACISDMGDIPFWGERLKEGESDWNTVNCLEVGTPIPSTVDGVPQTEKLTRKCDLPQQIYSHCESDATTGSNGPRVAHARNDQGTHWVLLCRKTHTAQGRYEDMAMIGHNPFTGQTCFFQNQLPFGEDPKPSNDGMHIPHPADNVSSEESPQVWNDLWGGIQGGIGPRGGINCQGCHSTDPFILSPWIAGAKNPDGTSVVPKMGENPDFVEGYHGPYRILDAQDQGWNSPKMLVSEEAAACTKCHRIGLDQWTANSQVTARNNEDGGCVFCGQAPWMDRLEGKQTAWENLVTESHQNFENTYWMPPNAKDVLNEELWPESEYAKAMSFIRKCGTQPTLPECKWEALPEEPGDPAALPEVEETGVKLAEEALGILGAKYKKDGVEIEGTRRCAECHATSKVGFRDWMKATNEAIDAGIDIRKDPDEMTKEQALEAVNFMRKAGEGSVFAAAKVGIFSPGVQFSYFQKLFRKAYEGAWGIHYGAFLQRVSMPKGSHLPMSAREFAVVMKWFVDEKLAHIDEVIVEIPPPANCEEVLAANPLPSYPAAAPWLADHIDEMQFDGWGARNLEAGINMFGCDKPDDPLTCFSEGKTDKSEWIPEGKNDGQRLLVIKELGFDTSFWMRSSADGRFVGNGGRGSELSGFGATITDLVTGRDIGVKGSYDPGFFPNNDGFIMQGGGAGLCGQSILTDETLSADGIDFTEPGCSKAEGINLYQHVAVDLDGGDYFIINSQFTSDSGSGNKDPRASFSETSTMKFSPLVFTGAEWTQKESVIVDSPYEGDSVLSPSGKLVISRHSGPDGVALGHMIRKVNAAPSGDSYTIDVDTPGQFLCSPGAKQNISFDERWAVTHAYDGKTANLFLSDLLTGQIHQITNMPEGRKALFPHFRSDGWIYFLVTGKAAGAETDEGDFAMATDAALLLAQVGPEE